MQPAVVIAAYNRPHALKRLLGALSQAEVPAGTPLVISVDPGGRHQVEVVRLAQRFEWPHGEKAVTVHGDHLGLVEHILRCGDYAAAYGAAIRLEDDHVVGRQFYTFARQALSYYGDDDRIAGIALYGLWFNGFTHTPFLPLLDAADVFFMQNPWSHGQAFTANQWKAFRRWWGEGRHAVTPADPLHEVYTRFPPTDWFPGATKYLVEQGKFFVFPRESHTTHFGDAGTHFTQPTGFYQVRLQQHKQRYTFTPLDASHAVYDAFQELLPNRLNRLSDSLAAISYTVDLNATKSRANTPTPYTLTTRPTRRALMRFGKVLRPLAANVIEGSAGQGIALAHRDDVCYAPWLAAAAHADNARYFARRYRRGRRQWVAWWAARLLRRLPKGP
jgi:hypothetical protein